MSDTHDQNTPEPGSYPPPPAGAYPPPQGAYPPPPQGAYPPPQGAYPPPPQGAYPPPPGAYPPPPQGAYPPPQGAYPSPYATQPGYGPQGYPPPYQPRTSRGIGFAIASLVLGVGALVFSWLPFIGILACLAGIAGIVLGAIALAKAFAGKGMSIAGIVTGGIAVILAILLTTLWFGAIFSHAGDVASHPLATSSPAPKGGGGDDGKDSGSTTFHATTQSAPVAFGGTVSYDNGVTVTVPSGTPYTPQDPTWSTQAVDLGYDVTVHNGSGSAITVNLIGETTADGTDGDDILDDDLDTMKDFPLAAGATHTYHIAFSVASQNDVTLSVSVADHYAYAEFAG